VTTGLHPRSRRQLLGTTGQVWFTNVLVFALAFSELDRGGRSPESAWHARGYRRPTSGSRRTKTTT
jgi:hypothetical protein